MQNDDNDQMEVDDPPLVDNCLCVVCEDRENLKTLSDTLAENLATNLSAFNMNNVLGQERQVNAKLTERLQNNGQADLEKALKGHNYQIHKRCYDKFNSSHLNRAINTAKKSKKDGDTSITTRSQCPPVEKFVEFCMYCGGPGKDDPKHTSRFNPLHAAAADKASSSYVDDFTKTVRQMATELGEIKVLNVLGNDVRSSELYYHSKCHVNFRDRYKKAIKNKKEDNGNSVSDDFAVLTAVKDFIDDSDDDSFDLHELEDIYIYIEGLAERGKVIESHITRFACRLENANIGLTIVQSSDGGKYKALKTKRLQAIIPDSDWVQLLRKVVDPIRNEIFEIHEMEKPAVSDLCTESPPLPYHKLSLLVTYLCHSKPDFRDIPLPLDTMCQQIILNTKKSSRLSKTQTIRHAKSKECHRIQHETLKLYSVIRVTYTCILSTWSYIVIRQNIIISE